MEIDDMSMAAQGKEEIAVTVCVAAICHDAMIVGASDRMLSTPSIQFEPEKPKLVPLTSSIVAMNAGDESLQDEILQGVRRIVQEKVKAQPDVWLTVREVATLYQQTLDAIKLRRAERSILVPLGLTINSFTGQQAHMKSEVVSSLTQRLQQYQVGQVASIITGVDSDGPHIYVVRDGQIAFHDSVGFAAIGSGEAHAASEMMFSGHTRSRSLSETLLLVYTAKKRAEVSPHVGEATDMVTIGPQLGQGSSVTPEHLIAFDGIYRRMREREMEAAAKAKEEMQQYDKKVREKATVLEQNTESAALDGSTIPVK